MCSHCPGGDAEAAGVSVGDQVVEVNGEECETVRDATKIVALKLMIQQTAIREVTNHTPTHVPPTLCMYGTCLWD